MKNVKKVLALLLVAVFLVSSLAACGKGDDKKTDDKGSQTQDDKKDDTNDKQDDSNTGDDSQGDDQAAGDGWSWPLPEKKELFQS